MSFEREEPQLVSSQIFTKQPMESQNENWVVRDESVWSFLFLFSFNIFYYLTSEPLCLWKRKGKVITRQWQLQLGAGNGASSFQLCWLKFNKRQYEMICKSVTFFFNQQEKKLRTLREQFKVYYIIIVIHELLQVVQSHWFPGQQNHPCSVLQHQSNTAFCITLDPLPFKML